MQFLPASLIPATYEIIEEKIGQSQIIGIKVKIIKSSGLNPQLKWYYAISPIGSDLEYNGVFKNPKPRIIGWNLEQGKIACAHGIICQCRELIPVTKVS